MICLNCQGEGNIVTKFSDFELTPVVEKCWVCQGCGEVDDFYEVYCDWEDYRKANEDTPQYE